MPIAPHHSEADVLRSTYCRSPDSQTLIEARKAIHSVILPEGDKTSAPIVQIDRSTESAQELQRKLRPFCLAFPPPPR